MEIALGFPIALMHQRKIEFGVLRRLLLGGLPGGLVGGLALQKLEDAGLPRSVGRGRQPAPRPRPP